MNACDHNCGGSNMCRAGSESRGRQMDRPTRHRRWLGIITMVLGVVLGTAPMGHAQPTSDGDQTGTDQTGEVQVQRPKEAEPTGADFSPFPEYEIILDSYTQRNPADFFTASHEGVWFMTPLGLNCGIWDRGSFGCTGDIRGAPPGTTEIGWQNGNIVTRYDANDPLFRIKFAHGQAEQALPLRNYVSYNGTTCATMSDTSTYCVRGPFKFFVTPTRTWLSPP